MYDKQLKEATKRKKLLNIVGKEVTQFTDEGVVNAVNTLEEKCGALAYHIIKTETQFYTEYSILYVSSHEENWSEDRNELKNGTVLAYVYNDSYAEGKFDFINIKSEDGQLKRNW